MKTGPTAIETPLYPLFLALCIRLFGRPIWITYAILACTIVVNALVPAFLPRVSSMLFGTPVPGIAGGVLSILAIRLILDWDANYTQLALLLFCLMTTQLLTPSGNASWRGAIVGVALGTLFLLNQVTVLVAVPWIGFVILARRTQLRDLRRFLIPLLLAAVLVNFPWLLRNYGIWGKLVTRTNLGMTLYVSNNDCATHSIQEGIDDGCYAATHPESSLPEATLLLGMGEPAYDRLKTTEALSWIRSHPKRFAQLTLARIVQFWFPVPLTPRFSAYAVWLITLLSIPGFILLRVRHVSASLFLGAVFLIYPLIYYVVVSAIRYRLPVLWLSCLTAGYFLTAFASRPPADSAESRAANPYWPLRLP